MTIGHLPSGYILAKTLIKKLQKSGIPIREEKNHTPVNFIKREHDLKSEGATMNLKILITVFTASLFILLSECGNNDDDSNDDSGDYSATLGNSVSLSELSQLLIFTKKYLQNALLNLYHGGYNHH